MVQLGYDSYLGLTPESVWGVYEDPTIFVPFTKENLKGDMVWVERKSEQRSNRFGWTPVQGRRAFTGGFTFNGYPHVMGLLLASFLGDAVTDVVTVPGVWRHEYIAGTTCNRQLSTTIRKGLTLPRDGCGYKANEMNFTQDNEKLLEVEIAGNGKQEDAGVAEVAVFTETFPFIFWQATLTANAGAVTYYCDNVNLKFNQTIKQDNWKISGGQTIMNQPFQDRPLFGGTFVIDFENWDEYNRFYDFTDMALRLEYISSEDVVPGTPYQMIIDLPKVRYKNNMPEVGSSALLTQNIEFECFADNVYGYDTPIHVYLYDGEATH